jgi:beta-galactosidase/beta-glucuronidase
MSRINNATVRTVKSSEITSDRIGVVVGEHVWNFADFETSNGIHRVDGNTKGVFTRDRSPKATAHALRACWTSLTNLGSCTI